MHRDLKLDNIMIKTKEAPYKIKLIDLGLSKEIIRITNSNLGTPETMAPEVQNERYTFSADIYSLGVIMKQILISL